MEILQDFAQWLLHWGPLGLMVLAFLDSAGIPLPAGVDALLIAVAVTRPSLAWLASSLATAGSLAGFLVLYWLARKGGEHYLDKHTASGRGKRLRAWFRRYGLAAVFVPTLSPVPLPTKVFVLCAGALRVPAGSFAAVVLAARLLRYLGLAYLGVRLGQESHQWIKANALWVTATAVGLFLAAALLFRRFTGEKSASS